MSVDLSNRNYWKKEEEDLLRQWADKAQCYQWMHSKSRDIYSKKNALFTIPVIIISTITGTANFAQDRFSDDIKNYVVISIGTLSIIAGIITTVSQFLKIAELNEGHRVSSLSWGKFYRTIKTELTRHPLDRMPPLEMIKISRDEFDRLVELSPFIPNSVIKEFNIKFHKNIDLTKPEICDELSTTSVFELNDEERMRLLGDIKKEENPREVRRKQIIKNKLDEKTNKFRETFHSLNGRYPTKEEVSKNMSKFLDDEPETIEMDNSVVLNIGPPVEESSTDTPDVIEAEVIETSSNDTITQSVDDVSISDSVNGSVSDSVPNDQQEQDAENSNTKKII